MRYVDDFTPAGTTITERFEDVEKYMRETTEVLFDVGMKIKERNIFYILLLKDSITKQKAFSIMIGDKVIYDYFTHNRDNDE